MTSGFSFGSAIFLTADSNQLNFIASHELKEQILARTEQDLPPVVSQDLMDKLSERTGSEENLACLRSTTQKELSHKIDLHKYQLQSKKINELGNVREIARLASLSLPNAGAWLNVVPSPSLGLHLRSSEFTVSVKYRLGMDIFHTAGKCTACPHQSDRTGDHAISCGYEGERIARHDHLRNALYTTCSQACLGPTKEVRDLVEGTNARPADLFLPNWTEGQDTALDVTVVNPLQISMVHQAAECPGHALIKAYERKMNRHGEQCKQAGVVFTPLPLETLGGWHETTVNEVRKIASALSRQTGEEEGTTVRHVVQRLSILLIKGNAALLLNRVPTIINPSTNGVE